MLPEILVDPAHDALLDAGIADGERRQQIFRLAARGVTVGRTFIFHKRQRQACANARDVSFADVDKGTDHRDLAACEIGARRKGVDASFVEQAHEERFDAVVHVVAERNLVAAVVVRPVVDGAAAHARAEGAGIFLLAFFKDQRADLAWDDLQRHAQPITERSHLAVVVSPAEVQRDSAQRKIAGQRALEHSHRVEQERAVLAAGKTDSDAVSFFDEAKLAARSPHFGKEVFVVWSPFTSFQSRHNSFVGI